MAASKLPEHLRQIAAASANPLIRDAEARIARGLASTSGSQTTYRWRAFTPEAFTAVLQQRCRTVEEINRLYWRDFARDLEAYVVLSEWRAAELGRGAVALAREGQVIPPAILARSLIELTTMVILNGGDFREVVEKASEVWDEQVMVSNDLETMLLRALYGTRQVEKDHELFQRNIVGQIEKLGKNPGFEPIPAIYARLCEVAHPNVIGNARFWSNLASVNEDGSHTRLLRRDQVSGDPINQIGEDTLFGLSWGLENVQIGSQIMRGCVARITRRFPRTQDGF